MWVVPQYISNHAELPRTTSGSRLCSKNRGPGYSRPQLLPPRGGTPCAFLISSDAQTPEDRRDADALLLPLRRRLLLLLLLLLLILRLLLLLPLLLPML